MVLTGDALLVGDAGRPDLHAARRARPSRRWRGTLYRSLTSACWRCPTICCSIRPTTRARSAGAGSRAIRPRRSASSAATTRRSRFESEDEFVAALLEDIPPAPEHQAEIVAANRSGRPSLSLA